MINLIIVAFISLFNSCAESNNEVEYFNYNKSLAKLISAENIDKEKLEILIDKSDYKLAIIFNGKVVKEYPVVFGTNPVDDKLMEGDRCTPEGNFKVRDFYPHKSWNKFIWIDYPTKESWENHNKAKAEDEIPNTATIGGEIGIHGVPGNADYLIKARKNWTLGCISLTNDDINEIYPFINKAMKIRIRQ